MDAANGPGASGPPGTARAWSASSHVAAPRVRTSRAVVGVLTRRSARSRARSMPSRSMYSLERDASASGFTGAVLGTDGAGRCSSRSAVAVASSVSAGSVHPSSTPSVLVACTRSSRSSSSAEALVLDAALIRYTRATSDAQHGASARRGACEGGPRPMAPCWARPMAPCWARPMAAGLASVAASGGAAATAAAAGLGAAAKHSEQRSSSTAATIRSAWRTCWPSRARRRRTATRASAPRSRRLASTPTSPADAARSRVSC